MKRFLVVTPELYRGGEPSSVEVAILKNIWGVHRVISLDKGAGDRIDPICNKLGLDHVMIPLEFDSKHQDAIDYITENINDLIITNSPTFVHCVHGKDRTGFVVALFRIRQGWSLRKALLEALAIGFGTGLDDKEIRRFVSALKKAATSDDNAVSDIVTLERDGLQNVAIPVNNSSSFAPITPVESDGYPIDTSSVNDRAIKRKKRMDDMNDAMANVGLINDVNPLLRGISPEGAGPMGIMPYGNYYL